MRVYILLISLLCCHSFVYCQEEFIMPPATLLTKVRFTQLSGGIVIVKAQLDSFPDSLNFVMDTGSGGISLDSTTAAFLQLPLVKSERTIRGIGGVRAVDFTNNHRLTINGYTAEGFNFHINNYELLTSVYGVKIDGIIGFSFLRRHIVKLDYDQQIMEVYSPGSMKYPKGGYFLKPNFTTLPIAPAIIEDDRAIFNRFIFDTGAGLAFLLSQEFVDDSTIFKKHRKFYPTQAEGLGGKRQMDVAVVDNIRFGPYKFRNVPIHVFDDTYNVTNYPLMGGLIGNEILRRFNVIINYPDQSIHLKANNHFNEPFDYSYTGLGIYLIDGEIRVIDIIPGSPGEKAGFKTGDIIFSVEQNMSKNIQAYKSLFQNSLGKVNVIVFRDQLPLVIEINVKDIRRR